MVQGNNANIWVATSWLKFKLVLPCPVQRPNNPPTFANLTTTIQSWDSFCVGLDSNHPITQSPSETTTGPTVKPNYHDFSICTLKWVWDTPQHRARWHKNQPSKLPCIHNAGGYMFLGRPYTVSAGDFVVSHLSSAMCNIPRGCWATDRFAYGSHLPCVPWLNGAARSFSLFVESTNLGGQGNFRVLTISPTLPGTWRTLSRLLSPFTNGYL